MEQDGSPDEDQTSLSSVSQGAGLYLLGRGSSNLLGFATNLILTRFLGAGLYGIYAYLNVLFSLFMVFTRLGGDKAIMRFLPAYEDEPRKRRAVLTLAYGTSLLTSVIAALLVYFFAPLISSVTLNDPLLTDVLRISAIVIPFNTLSMITFSVFRGIERMDYNIGVSSIVKPVFRLVFLGGAVVLGYSLVGVAAGLIVSGVLTLIVALTVLYRRTDLGPVARPHRSDAAQYYEFSIPLTFDQLGSYLYNRVDILMVGFLLSGSAVGVYNITVLVSSFLSLPLTAFNQLFPSIASKLYHSGQIEELESTYRSVTRLTFTLALLPGIGVFVYSPEIVHIFGEDFVQGKVILMLFVISQMTNALVGPTGYLLMMSDHQYVSLLNQVSSGVINVILNYVLITHLGFIGAALATASVLTIVNISRIIEIWHLENLFAYDWSFAKPILAGLVAGTVMYVLSFFFKQYSLLLIGGGTGTCSFFCVLYFLGIEDADIVLINELLPETYSTPSLPWN